MTVDWSQRESVRAKLRLMVKRILRKDRCPPDAAEAAVDGAAAGRSPEQRVG
jgi:type I restriction enzyme, R subunit